MLFEINNTEFQIDTLLIFQKIINLIDVKYFERDYYIEGDIWYSSLTGKEIKNPLLQLNRCQSLPRRLLQELGCNMPIEANVVFNHPEFTLYQATRNLPIILPTQLNRLMKKINNTSSSLIQKHINLADKLISKHLNKSAHLRLAVYK